mgnify:CR=1 FL=1|tara:strand:- start:28 stop:1164 length:1137 start_codon:yes stop_codon:yes gene_type:complete
MSHLFNDFSTYFKRDKPPPSSDKINQFNSLTFLDSYQKNPPPIDEENKKNLDEYYKTLYNFQNNQENLNNCLQTYTNEESYNCFRDKSVILKQNDYSNTPNPTISSMSSNYKCGGAVNVGADNCDSDLFNPTGNNLMHCYAYGGPNDPCALHQNNDENDGLDKNPIKCNGDTFFLWDEPDTQDKSYEWAAESWIQFLDKYRDNIDEARRKGMKFTSPLFKSGPKGVLVDNINEFFDTLNELSNYAANYIDVIAVNTFCVKPESPNSYNEATCPSGVKFILDELNNLSNNLKSKPIYITNWSYLGPDATPDKQVAAMEAARNFFDKDNYPDINIERVYWFGAKDYGGGTQNNNNFLTKSVPSLNKKLGEIWNNICSTIK